MDEWITREQFHNLTRPLIGLPVSKTWRGFGSAIFFEFGELTIHQKQRENGIMRESAQGQSGVMLEWSWRVERPKSILFGSWSHNRTITSKLAKLQGLTILEIAIEGRLPELVIQLSGGHWVHSFSTVGGQPEWCLFLDREATDTRWITSNIGKLVSTTQPVSP